MRCKGYTRSLDYRSYCAALSETISPVKSSLDPHATPIELWMLTFWQFPQKGGPQY